MSNLLAKIVTDGGMSFTPSMYTGRGNTTSDLNPEILEKIYLGIRNEIGHKEAKAFVNMVADMTADASATTFLLAIRDLEANDWKYVPEIIPVSRAAALSGAMSIEASRPDVDARKLKSAFAGGVLSSMFGSNEAPRPGSGYMITGAFLKKYKNELDNPLPEFNEYSHRFY